MIGARIAKPGCGLALASLLSVAGCAPMAAPPNGYAAAGPRPTETVWRAEDIGGGGIIDNSHVTLALGADGVASGGTNCNRYTARYSLAGAQLAIAGIASTKRACAPALMHQEARYIGLLAQVAHWRIEATGALVLTTAHGVPLRFFPDETPG